MIRLATFAAAAALAFAASTPAQAGPLFQGLSLNGLTFNGPLLQGLSLNSIKFNGWTINGPVLQGLRMNGQASGDGASGLVLRGITLGGGQSLAMTAD